MSPDKKWVIGAVVGAVMTVAFVWSKIPKEEAPTLAVRWMASSPGHAIGELYNVSPRDITSIELAYFADGNVGGGIIGEAKYLAVWNPGDGSGYTDTTTIPAGGHRQFSVFGGHRLSIPAKLEIRSSEGTLTDVPQSLHPLADQFQGADRVYQGGAFD